MSNSIAATAKKFAKSLPKAERALQPPAILLTAVQKLNRRHATLGAKQVAWRYHDSLRRCHLNIAGDGWYIPDAGLRDNDLDDLARFNLVEIAERENPEAVSKHFRQIFVYRLTEQGAELIGVQTIQENTAMVEFTQNQEVLFEEAKATIKEVGQNGRYSIDMGNGDRPIWVDAVQLTPLTGKAAIPAEIKAIASDDAHARKLYGVVNTILKHGDWFIVLLATQDRSAATTERRELCEHLHKHKLLQREYRVGKYIYRLTQTCCDMLAVPYPYEQPESQSIEQQHPDLYKLAQRLNPEVVNVDGIVEMYIGVLKLAHSDTSARAWTRITNRKQQLHFATQLNKGGFVVLRNHESGVSAEWQITEVGSMAIDCPHPEIAPEVVEAPEAAPDAESAAPQGHSAVDQAEAVINAASDRPAVEIKTLRQDVNHPEKLERADCELSEHLSADWSVMDISYIRSEERGTSTRFIMLQRRNQPQPVQPQRAMRYVEPIGPAIELGPLARNIILNGVDETIADMDTAVLNRFRDALAQSMTVLPSRTLIPAATPEVK